MVGWLENEFLKKTLSPKFGLESQLGTSDLEFVSISHISNIDDSALYYCMSCDVTVKKAFYWFLHLFVLFFVA